MTHVRSLIAAVFLLAISLPGFAVEPNQDKTKERVAEVQKRLGEQYDKLEALYKHLHAN